ncbi:5-(carboxyamino)imidazole ribonucleotide synthase [Formicincola oecophyllae]|uniref:N5-carboxyaminoimidazole ribonucleotide synthase n=1 Tax=Formicincola oecophyllae TaxID=2558361 RepID=A0A4Y6UCN0_9PROT|nr:5-(carboxyamino)imidazole ribonucleotide synthase [Formicincola oecophyllae]QDH14197.1 5-(carboxyamino)imidazole ribonucleotide synthase [Formicincola oecophyllae]
MPGNASAVFASFPSSGIIGIVGGGQLGRMSAQAAAKLGLRVHILADGPDSPASEVAWKTTVGRYDDPAVLERFAAECDVVTFEFENISEEGLAHLETLRPVRPARRILQISQDRLVEKATLEELGFEVAPWRPVRTEAELAALADFPLPFVLKTTRLGYDGKGQRWIRTEAEREALLNGQDAKAPPLPLVAEGKVDFARELSVMVARSPSGTIINFPATENHHRDGILRLSIAPAPITPERTAALEVLACHLAEKLGLEGLMGIEFFEAEDGRFLINEIAPRPHNSGHWTQNGCTLDQFEAHIRSVADMPLPKPWRHSDVAMSNIIGPDDMAQVPAMLREEAAAVHLYGKKEARPGRKMGHVNRPFPKGAMPGLPTLATFKPALKEG